MNRPVCVKCEVVMRMGPMGVYVIELFQGVKICRIWSADVYECPKCGFQIIGGWGNKPLANNFDDKRMRETNAAMVEAKKLTDVDGIKRIFYWREK